MFERLDRLPDDAILGLMAAFRADTDPRKVDLGVGVYRDELGNTPVPVAVRRAEADLFERQTTKSYVSPTGNAGFNQAMGELVFGDTHAALTGGRVRTIQTPGGCAALRLGAELIKVSGRQATVYMSVPTWANHAPLLGGSGLKLGSYPYYDAASGGLAFATMQQALHDVPEGSVVLLHASCHNPTGVDLTPAQWRELLVVFKHRALLPFIDMAYQGLGTNLEEDAFGIRLFAAELPEVLVAVSCSKNFGLYRERTGSLHVVSDSHTSADAALSQLARIARTIYSMPPDHGAAIVQALLADESLRIVWLDELAAMRERITGLRSGFVEQLAVTCPERDFSCMTRQLGMFSLLGVNKEQVRELRLSHHIYMTDDSRINIAGLRTENLAYVAQSIAQVLEKSI
jgi:aspartate aminotransferase